MLAAGALTTKSRRHAFTHQDAQQYEIHTCARMGSLFSFQCDAGVFLLAVRH